MVRPLRGPVTRRFSRGVAMLCVIAFASLALACSTLSSSSGDDEDRDPSEEGLVEIPIDGPGYLFVHPERPHAAYDSIMFSPVEASFKRGSGRRQRDIERIRAFAEEKLQSIAEVARVSVVDTPGPCTLGVDIEFHDIDIVSSESGAGSNLHFVESWGAATIVEKIFDSESRALLLQYSLRRRVPGSSSGVGGAWSRVEQTLEVLIRDSQAALTTALPLDAKPPSKTGCQGLIYRQRIKDVLESR